MEVFFINDRYDKGIRNITDITNGNGLFCDFLELKRRYNIKGAKLDYTRLLKKYTLSLEGNYKC